MAFPPNNLSSAESVTVQKQSQFTIAVDALTECPMDVFVLPMEPFQAFVDGEDGSGRPEKIRNGLRSVASEHAPADLRFIGAGTGRGTAELSAGAYQMVFSRACELGSRTAIELTAEVGRGDSDPGSHPDRCAFCGDRE